MARPTLPESGAAGPGMSDNEFMAAITGGAKTPEEFAAWVRKERRRVAYENGRYSIEVPPVHTGNWTIADWMRWVDACDGWDDKSLKDPL